MIAAVFGLFGLLSNMWNAVAPFFFEGIMSAMTGDLGGEVEEAVQVTVEITRAWRNWTVAIGLVGVLVSGMLFVGGVLLLMRRAASAQLLKYWAMVRMAMVLVAAYIGYLVQQQTFEAMNMQAQMADLPQGFLGAATMIGIGFTVAFGWALPVIMLVWFARPSIKDEVEGWM
jgi:hypothetical protein